MLHWIRRWIQDAPDTAKFRAGIDILKNYAGLIKSLVEGKDAAVAREQIKQHRWAIANFL